MAENTNTHPVTGSRSDSAHSNQGINAAGVDLRVEARLARIKEFEERHRAAAERNKVSAIVYEIDKALYKKAAEHNADLTDDERAMLLSRDDVVGKALAHPESLTTEELHQVMFWPEPDRLRERIQHWTKGTLSEPLELYAKVKEALEQGKLQELSDGEVHMVAHNFTEVGNPKDVPGNFEAHHLMRGRLGIDQDVLLAVCMHMADERDFAAERGRNARRLHERMQKWSSGDGMELQADLGTIVGGMSRSQGQWERGEVDIDEYTRRNQKYVACLKEFVQEQQRWESGRADSKYPYVRPKPSVAARRGAGLFGPQSGLPFPYNLKLGMGAGGFQSDTNTGFSGQRRRVFNKLDRTLEIKLFWKDIEAELGVDSLAGVFEDFGAEVKRRWDALSEEQRAAYTARAYPNRPKVQEGSTS